MLSTCSRGLRRAGYRRASCPLGSAGAPGRTTVAVNLAAELARLGQPTVLVDADTYGGCVAQSLSLLDEAPGLAAATRSAGLGRGRGSWRGARSRLGCRRRMG